MFSLHDLSNLHAYPLPLVQLGVRDGRCVLSKNVIFLWNQQLTWILTSTTEETKGREFPVHFLLLLLVGFRISLILFSDRMSVPISCTFL